MNAGPTFVAVWCADPAWIRLLGGHRAAVLPGDELLVFHCSDGAVAFVDFVRRPHRV